MVYFEFRIAVFTEMCLLSFKYFCNSWKNCWRITYCLQRGILSFQFALVMNNFVNKQTCDLFWNNIAKTLFYKTKVFIAVNVTFENWQISVETYPHILHFFFFLNIWWFITVGVLRFLSSRRRAVQVSFVHFIPVYVMELFR